MDFIAKGKTKTLRVRTPLLKVTVFHSQISKLSSFYRLQFGETNPGSLFQSFGGVGRNLAGVFLHCYIICAPINNHPGLKFTACLYFKTP